MVRTGADMASMYRVFYVPNYLKIFGGHVFYWSANTKIFKPDHQQFYEQ